MRSSKLARRTDEEAEGRGGGDGRGARVAVARSPVEVREFTEESPAPRSRMLAADAHLGGAGDDDVEVALELVALDDGLAGRGRQLAAPAATRDACSAVEIVEQREAEGSWPGRTAARARPRRR